ncbi:MAG TPA: histidine phosphatase family protein [Xanthobacteraceae bacterium]|jgi:phosphohistidine phosphatase|nr:histidine phosphatase family protein [Xanthobacteraceae bacterium]
MRRLMLLRHAKSELSQPGKSDRDRPLTRRGEEAAPKIGAFMAKHGLLPDHVLCSPARRARDTWVLVAKAFKEAPPTDFNERLYGAGADGLLDLLRETGRKAHSLLVVGHNPGLQELAVRLIASGELAARERLHEKLPTAGLVVIDFPFDDWTKLHPQAGRLDRFVTPRSLATATD